VAPGYISPEPDGILILKQEIVQARAMVKIAFGSGRKIQSKNYDLAA
jgi:hypothetical protein